MGAVVTNVSKALESTTGEDGTTVASSGLVNEVLSVQGVAAEQGICRQGSGRVHAAQYGGSELLVFHLFLSSPCLSFRYRFFELVSLLQPQLASHLVVQL